jgi:release factor glutamine methyltransferase
MQSHVLYQSLVRSLTLPASAGEKQAMIRWLLEERLGLQATELLSGKDVPVSVDQFEDDIGRLNREEPLQYVLGVAEFFGRRFLVNPAVLIPRPETELLVRYILGAIGNKQEVVLLDLGTGSGCIATTLALELPSSNVHAADINPAALEVAKENAQRLGATIQFHLHDILKDKIPVKAPVDVVVSNPPYIRRGEAGLLARNVIAFEPANALFVPDDEPLLFHQAIAQNALTALRPGGLLVMEINEALGKETFQLVKQAGYSDAAIHRDLDGKDRFISASRP